MFQIFPRLASAMTDNLQVIYIQPSSLQALPQAGDFYIEEKQSFCDQGMNFHPCNSTDGTNSRRMPLVPL